ncbi:hypothetical protein GW17_00041905 [Ensete ventricosum]|nr:hypothetical protein GW17_00041905 [Ensete ventricosum]RZS13932.1 hypothetical protein BHM03_00045572 [Ensete ventricosum]
MVLKLPGRPPTWTSGRRGRAKLTSPIFALSFSPTPPREGSTETLEEGLWGGLLPLWIVGSSRGWCGLVELESDRGQAGLVGAEPAGCWSGLKTLGVGGDQARLMLVRTESPWNWSGLKALGAGWD